MPADWINFINNVGAKLDGKDIEGAYDKPGQVPIDDFSTYLANQYVQATVGKAQSPFGNLHQRGESEVIITALTRAYKMLESERSPTLKEKENDPLYAELEEPLPTFNLEDYLEKFNVEFRFWAEANGASIPDFTYSMFFSQFPNYPQTREQQVLEIARRIVYKFDGTSDYLQWIYSLKLDRGPLSDWSKEIYNKIVEITSEFGDSEVKIGDQILGKAYYKTDFFNNESEVLDGETVISGKVVGIDEPNEDGVKFYRIASKDNRGFPLTRRVSAETAQKKLDVSNFSRIQNLNITNKIFQEEHMNDPERIPDYLTESFIAKFTYDPQYDKNFFYRAIVNIFTTRSVYVYYGDITEQIASQFSSDNVLYDRNFSGLLRGDFSGYSFGFSNYLSEEYLANTTVTYDSSTKIGDYLQDMINRTITLKTTYKYRTESSRFRDLKIRYIQELADNAKKPEDPEDPNDPYSIMAGGFINYWKSCTTSPLGSSPPVFPCTILPPGNGIYAPLYYGSRKKLGDNLRRAFNTGKKYTGPGAGRVVASALAVSFALHLAELKFLYNGGIPTPGGPAPMIGFIPLVF